MLRCGANKIDDKEELFLYWRPPCLRVYGASTRKNLMFRLGRSKISTSYKLREEKINQVFER